MNPVLKKIYKKIKQYKTIVIARHIGPDPDAIASQISLRDSIKLTFPDKFVYAIGSGVSKFRYYGNLDKLDESTISNALLIILDVPDLERVDGVDVSKYSEIVKIDHHPYDKKIASIEYVNDSASSTCQMVIELILNTKLKINKSIAENLFLGVVSDSDRFLLSYTTASTFQLVADLIKESKINFTSLYEKLYERPLVEIKFRGYLAQNFTVTENGLGYVIINSDIIKEYGVDTATASNLINDFNYIKEIYVWIFVTHDEKNEIYKVNIRSKGPIINEVAQMFNGGGHKFASGIRTTNKDDIDKIIQALDNACKEYKKEITVEQ